MEVVRLAARVCLGEGDGSWGGTEGRVRSCLRLLNHLRRLVKSTTPRFCVTHHSVVRTAKSTP